MIFSFRSNFSQKFSLSGNYRLGFAKGDTDGAGSTPAYAYDFAGEFGRSSFDIRHNFVLFGNVTLPWSISLNPFIIASSGRPFNITKGLDVNGDGSFSERPTFSDLAARCSQLTFSPSFCNTTGFDPSAIVPRNFGVGPSSLSVNLRVGKNFGFGKSAASQARGGASGGGPGMVMVGGPGGGGRSGGGPMGGMFGGGGDVRKPYNLNVSVNFSNLLNKVNLGTPVGSLASSRFGQSVSTGGGFGGFGGGGGGGANRRIELQMRFSW